MSSVSASRSDFYTALLPCHKLQLYLGLADFRLEGPVGHRQLKIIKLQSWYKLTFIFLALAVIVVFVLLNDVIAPFKSENEFYWFVAAWDLHCDYVSAIAMLMSTLLFRKYSIKSWHGVMDVDHQLRRFSLTINNAFVKRFSQICITFNFICNTLSHFTTDDVISHQEIKFFLVSNVLYWILNIYRFCTDITFQAWMLSLKLRFEALHEWLLNNETFVTKKELRQIQRIHHQLCDICRTTSRVYFLPILISLSMNLFIVIFQTYEFLVLFSKSSPNWKQMSNTFVFLLWEAFQIILTVATSALVSNHEQLLKRRLFDFVKVQDLQSEINSFSVQMLHCDTETSAAGFFTIDVALLFQMIGAGTTYLFIILQFYYLNQSSTEG